ncbi:MAG: Clo7bot family Cys-rich peptide [Clostridia bacterium]|nr:Clo7bot family Cys-rich peptide [Clostridia bacterium]
MKYLVQPSKNITEGYCYGCGSQCQNDCTNQCMSKSK